MPPNIDHRDPTLSIYEMVLNRLPFLMDTPENQDKISEFTLEIMWALESCFKVSVLPDGTVDPDRVGQEQYYTVLQQSIIADLVAVQVIMVTIAGNSQGVGGAAPTGQKYLKRAKAGTSEAEWAAFTVKDTSSFFMDAPTMVERYRKAAQNKALTLGCILDICDTCIEVINGFMSIPIPMMVIDCGCQHC